MVCRLLLDDPVGFRTSAVAATLCERLDRRVHDARRVGGHRRAGSRRDPLLSPAVGAGNAAVIATTYRIVTAGGDALLCRARRAGAPLRRRPSA
jgi:hypothetical protein